MAATNGTGSGTFSGVTTVNFAAQTIANTYSGNLTLDGNDAVDFSYSFTTDYSGGSASSSVSRIKIISVSIIQLVLQLNMIIGPVLTRQFYFCSRKILFSTQKLVSLMFK